MRHRRAAEARDHKAISQWLHSLNSRPHFSRARLSAAPFTTSTRRASSFYAFIYAPFIIFKVRLSLARRLCVAVIYFLPSSSASRRPCVVVSLALFLFSCFLLWSWFFFLYYYVLACSRCFISVLRGEWLFLFFFINRGSHRIMVIKG